MKSSSRDKSVWNLDQRITSFREWVAAEVWFGKHAVRNRVMLAGAGILAVLAIVGSSGGSAESPAPPSFAVGGRPVRKPVSPAVWEAVRPRLEQTERDSASAVESQLARINEFFAERKRGARRFAEAVLGAEGKLRAAGGIAEGIAGAVGELFGNKPGPGEDSFTQYVRRCFGQHVLSSSQLQKAIESAVAGYTGEVRGLEGRLLVDLRADLDLSTAWPRIQFGATMTSQGDAVIAHAIDAAANDFVASIVKFTVSWVVGNAVGDRLTSEDDSALKKGVINAAVGVGVDKVIDEAVARGGYDPEGALAAKVMTSLDRMRNLLVEGDLLAGAVNPGLRHRLLALHAERSRLRSEALGKLVFGPGATPARIAPSPRMVTQKSYLSNQKSKGSR